MKLSPQTAWPFAVIPLVVLSDQVTKWMILAEPRLNGLACLSDGRLCGRIEVPGPMDLSMVWNRGMSYGLFQADGLMRWVLAGVMAAIAIGFFFWLLRAEGRWLKASLALVVGGAIGNLIDRLAYGYVVDFVLLYWRDWSYPAFNVADSAITVGVGLLLYDGLVLERRREVSASSAP
jgi:signal peptidase II